MNVHSVVNVKLSKREMIQMSKLKSWRSLSFLLWIVITITMVVTMPNMDQLVKEKGKITIPNTKQSSIADKMMKEMDKEGVESMKL